MSHRFTVSSGGDGSILDWSGTHLTRKSLQIRYERSATTAQESREDLESAYHTMDRRKPDRAHAVLVAKASPVM